MSGFTPPLGINFRSTDGICAALLSKCLCRIAVFLQSTCWLGPVETYHDWWEHDGLHFHRGRVDVQDLFKLIETPRALLESTPADESVCVGIAPLDAEWHLRFRAEWNEPEDAVVGRFDLTLSASLAEEFQTSVVKLLECDVQEEPSLDYFKRITL